MTDQNFQPVEYVLGFAFHPYHHSVLLITKNRPQWQAGLLNGIGGRVESTDKTLEDAMVREFREETGVVTSRLDWKYLGEHAQAGVFSMSLFYITLDQEAAERASSTTDEIVSWFSLAELGRLFIEGVNGLPMYLTAAEFHLGSSQSTVRIGNLT